MTEWKFPWLEMVWCLEKSNWITVNQILVMILIVII